MDFVTSITKEEINELPIEVFPGSIIVVDTVEKLNQSMLFLNQQDLVGIDTETRPVFKKGRRNKVALIQISTYSVCFLIRLNLLGLTEELYDFLSNKDIVKVGLSLKDDFLMLKARNVKLEPKGFIELQEYVKDFGIEDESLQKIYAIIFNKKISKAQRLSNWEARVLSPRQQSYASLDAWACLRIYRMLNG